MAGRVGVHEQVRIRGRSQRAAHGGQPGNKLGHTGSSNWQTKTRRAAGAVKPTRSWPASSASARLATNKLLPIFGKPVT
jgi:hypothetical protein